MVESWLVELGGCVGLIKLGVGGSLSLLVGCDDMHLENHLI